MPGTKAGSLKAKQTMIAKYGEEGYRKFYAEIGRKGGKNGNTGGFWNNPERAAAAGHKGGKNRWAKRSTK